MAASGFTPLQLYRTSTASATPTAGNLSDGELAINLTDEKLYFKNASGVVKLLASSAAAATTGTVTSVALSGGTGISVSGSPITTSGTITVTNTGVTSLAAGTGISVSGSTGGVTVTALNNGTVTSVSGTGSVQGLTLSGTVTSSGSLTLGGSLSAVNLSSQVTGTLPIANGGTGATSAGVALTNLGAYPSSNPNGYTSNTGTVTSVAASAGTGISISGSPITTSGTLSISNTGVTSLSAGTGISLSGSTGAITVSAAGGGSAWEYLAVATGTAASSFTFTSGFNSSNYVAYAIEFDRVYINGSSGTLNVTLAYNGGSLISTASYLWGNGLMAGGASSTAWQESSGSNIPIGSLNFGNYFQGEITRAANGFLYIFNGGGSYPSINWYIVVNYYYTLIGGGMNLSNTGYPTSINLAPSVGTLNGTLRFYGLKKS